MSENSKLKEKSVIAMSAAKKQSDTSEVQNARVTRYKREPVGENKRLTKTK